MVYHIYSLDMNIYDYVNMKPSMKLVMVESHSGAC